MGMQKYVFGPLQVPHFASLRSIILHRQLMLSHSAALELLEVLPRMRQFAFCIQDFRTCGLFLIPDSQLSKTFG
jgi:hypothetical protein